MTGRDVFDIAVHIMDEQNESTGSTETADTKEYAYRSVSFLNILAQECYRLSDGADISGRAIFPRIKSLDDELQIDEHIAAAVLPYGLVYLLKEVEDTVLANICLQRYQEAKDEARYLPAESEPIEDVYGGIEYGEYSEW